MALLPSRTGGRFVSICGARLVGLQLEIPAHPVEQPVVAHQPAAIDHAGAGDGNIRQVFAPDQAVVKITVPAILIRLAVPGFRRIVSVHRLRRAEDHRAGVQIQMDVVGQMDAAAQIGARRNEYRSAAGFGCRQNRPVDRRAVQIRFPSPAAPKLRTLKTVLSFGEAIAGRRKQKEMKMAKVRVFIFRLWPNYQEFATAGKIRAGFGHTRRVRRKTDRHHSISPPAFQKSSSTVSAMKSTQSTEMDWSSS